MKPTRADAWQLLNEYTANRNLIKHAVAVEAAMRAYADRYGEDVEEWGIAGLLHDFDYDRFPDQHPFKGRAILEQLLYSDEVVHAIQAHADFTGVPRESRLDRALFSVDELCGFIVAATLVRPGKKVGELPVKSVRKKLKDKAFARAVSRDDIIQGAEDLGVDLNEHIAFVISAMSQVAEELGLAGQD